MEAEIVAISHCACELIPIIQMVEFLGCAIGLPVDCTLMHVCIHEDNAGALILADTLPPQYTPRSKHYHINHRDLAVVRHGNQKDLPLS